MYCHLHTNYLSQAKERAFEEYQIPKSCQYCEFMDDIVKTCTLELKFIVLMLLRSQYRRLETSEWMALRADFTDVLDSSLKERNLSIIGIAMHVGEVRLNDIKERAGIKWEEWFGFSRRDMI